MKEKDPFESFVQEHRKEFDSEEPSLLIWKKISRSNSTRTNYAWLWKVAAILLFGLSTYLIIEKRSGIDRQLPMVEFSEFSNTEAYYNTIIAVRKEELEVYIDSDSPFYTEFNSDISELDSIYGQLKYEHDTNDEDIVMDAMIQNLQLRIEIMDRQLQIIQKFKKLTKNKNSDEISI